MKILKILKIFGLLITLEILKISKELISEWDGKFYFAHLPSLERYVLNNTSIALKQIPQITDDLKINTIDMHGIFSKHPNPLSLFPFREEHRSLSSDYLSALHYNAEGYHLVAESIKLRLEKDYITP